MTEYKSGAERETELIRRWQWILGGIIVAISMIVVGIHILRLPKKITGTATVPEPLRLAVQKANPQMISEEKIEQAWVLDPNKPADYEVLTTADFSGQHYVDTLCRHWYKKCLTTLYGEIPGRSGFYIYQFVSPITYEVYKLGSYSQTNREFEVTGRQIHVEFTVQRGYMLFFYLFLTVIASGFGSSFLLGVGDALIVRYLLDVYRDYMRIPEPMRYS